MQCIGYVLLIPEIGLFIALNFVRLSHQSKVCQGEYISDDVSPEDKAHYKAYMPTEEGKVLFISLMIQWSLVAFIFLFGMIHICYTFWFRV